MAKVDVVYAFPCDHVEDEAEEYDGTPCVGKQLEVIVLHVRHSQKVELAKTAAAGGVDWKEDRPRYQAANQTHDHANLPPRERWLASILGLALAPTAYFDEAQKQVSVQRVVVEDPCVRNGIELSEPAKEAV